LPVVGSVAVKKSVPATSTSCSGALLPVTEISRTRIVPANVPLLFHSSTPAVASSAAKKRLEPTAFSSCGELD
jgi:hypothetical protein